MGHNSLLRWACCLALLLVVAVRAAEIGAKQETLAVGLKAVNKWLENNQLGCGWEDGTFMVGLETLHHATNDTGLYQTMLDYGDRFNWDLCLKLTGGGWNPDNQVCAAAYAQLYLDSSIKNTTWIAATIKQLQADITATDSTQNWSWVDALFMAMSVYARIGAATGKQEYFDKMHDKFLYAAVDGYAFWSSTDSLFYRDPPRGKADGVFWSRGNGWAAAALVQALQFAPVDDSNTETYRMIYSQHMAKLPQLQGEDGCWRCSLTDPGFYPIPETTGTALFTYAMAYGIGAGLLNATTYMPIVQKAWSCLTTVSLHPDGTVGNCQPGSWHPERSFGINSTSSFCVGHFALAATAVAQLAT